LISGKPSAPIKAIYKALLAKETVSAVDKAEIDVIKAPLVNNR